MLKIGLTGNYFSGHDEVSELFEEKGIKVFDADLVMRFMANYSIEHSKKIEFNIGSKAYNCGFIDPNFFNTQEKMNKLLDCLEIDLIKAYEKWRIKNYNFFYTIFKSSILFERKLNKNMNFTINVYRPKMQRKCDALYSSDLSTYNLEMLFECEWDEIAKNNSSNFIIHNYNSGSYKENEENLNDQIHNIHKKIMSRNQSTVYKS